MSWNRPGHIGEVTNPSQDSELPSSNHIYGLCGSSKIIIHTFDSNFLKLITRLCYTYKVYLYIVHCVLKFAVHLGYGRVQLNCDGTR